MKKRLLEFFQSNYFYTLLLLVVGAATYLPFISRLGLYGDSWYIIYDASTQGASFIHRIFTGDRPAIAYLLEFTYSLFGTHLPYYHLAVFLFRYAGALVFWGLLNSVWTENKRPNFLMALFYLLYPGFLNLVDPVVYQTHIFDLALATLSIALTVWAIKARSVTLRVLLTVFAVATGWLYLVLLEYSLGLEFFRFGFIALITWQKPLRGFKAKLRVFLKDSLPFLLIPIVFLVWRLFFFASQRPATDVGTQLGALTSAPVYTALWWLIRYFYSFINAVFSAWLVPLYDIVKGLRLRDIVAVTAGGAAIAALMALCLYRLWKDARTPEKSSAPAWIDQMLCLGSAGVLVCILPIIVANRSILFSDSRYTLVAVPGVSMILVAGLYLIHSRLPRMVLIGLLIFFSSVTHLGNALTAVHQADSLRSFWWQVSWRAPSIEAGTDLVAAYSLMPTPESYLVWGPANLIYYPEKQSSEPIEIRLPASILSEETVTNILGGGNGRDVNHRGNHVREDFTALLVMTQPTPESCVRILNGSMPELSPLDSPEVMLVAPYSRIGNVNLAESTPVLPEAIFGPEPEHTWCYFYEKAALAAQMDDWQTVLDLGEQAAQQGLKPADPVEWMPFLRAEVATGDVDALAVYVEAMKSDALIYSETCQILSKTAADSRPADPVMQTFITEKFCP